MGGAGLERKMGMEMTRGRGSLPSPGLGCKGSASPHPWKQVSIRVPQGSAENRLKGLLLDVHASHRAALTREAE